MSPNGYLLVLMRAGFGASFGARIHGEGEIKLVVDELAFVTIATVARS